MKYSNLNHFDCSGIYIIRNLKTKKVYIGSAKNIKQRLHEHNSMLRRNKHHSKYLQNVYNKNTDFLLFAIIEECKTENLIKREQYWLNFFQSFKKENGYNSVPTAYSSLGRKFSQGTKDKMSKSHKGMKKPWSKGLHCRKAIRHTKEGLITEYPSIQEASLSFNIHYSTISSLLRNNRKSKHGIFIYL
jgi:predicted GIY-YIG superfamily endonuclease